MVSKASEDLPDPLSPVITVKVLRGISTEMFLRLCWRAPRTVILSMAMEGLTRISAAKPSFPAGAHTVRSPRIKTQFYIRILVVNTGLRQCGLHKVHRK